MLNTLAVLWQIGAPVTVLQSMEMLEDTSPATVHRRLKTLRKKGFITLEMKDADNRVKHVMPTAITKQYYERLEDCLAKAQE